MNKDTVLPLVPYSVRDSYTSPEALAVQRDADWERVKALVEALRAIAEPYHAMDIDHLRHCLDHRRTAQMALAQFDEKRWLA